VDRNLGEEMGRDGERKSGILTSGVPGKGFFHHAVENGACPHESLVHGY
jgi:hypothetical protein